MLRSQGLHPLFTRSYAHRFFDLAHKDFAIADFSSLSRSQNCFYSSLRSIIRNHDFELYFWKEIHCVLGTAIYLAMPLLAAKSFYLAKSHSFDAGRH